MKLLCTLSDQNRLNEIAPLVDGVICGSYFSDRFYFGIKQLQAIRKETLSLGIELYILMDTMVQESDRQKLYEYMEVLKELGVDGIYFSDLAVLQVGTELDIKDRLIYESDTLMTNSLDVAYYLRQGLKGVVLARELTLNEIKTIASNNHHNVDLHIFGYQKMASSKRNFLSNYFNHIGKAYDVKDKLSLRIVEETRDGKMPILENANGTKIYSDYILSMYRESVELKDQIERAIIDDLFIDYEVLMTILKDYQNLNLDNADLLTKNLKLHFTDLNFDTAYLYQKTNTTK